MFQAETWSMGKTKKQRRRVTKEQLSDKTKADRSKRASHTKDARKDTERTRKKRELILEAVRDAGFPSFPLTKKTLL